MNSAGSDKSDEMPYNKIPADTDLYPPASKIETRNKLSVVLGTRGII
jgi:hypothetical protein